MKRQYRLDMDKKRNLWNIDVVIVFFILLLVDLILIRRFSS